MDKIKAIIVDDEEASVMALDTKIKEYCPDVNVVATGANVDQGIEAIQLHNPDIVFLDVNMPGGDGFSLLEKVGKISFEIIFITAYDQYALKAFHSNALHFLLKPIKSQDLLTAVERYKSRVPHTSMNQVLSLIHQMRSGQTMDRIALPISSGFKFVEFKDIIRLRPESNYTRFSLVDGSELLALKTFKEYEGLLEEHSFVRIHHSHIINLAHVVEYKKSSGIVVMTDNTEIEVSARKRTIFLEKINKFMKV